jgi:hypothetical protein
VLTPYRPYCLYFPSSAYFYLFPLIFQYLYPCTLAISKSHIFRMIWLFSGKHLPEVSTQIWVLKKKKSSSHMYSCHMLKIILLGNYVRWSAEERFVYFRDSWQYSRHLVIFCEDDRLPYLWSEYSVNARRKCWQPLWKNIFSSFVLLCCTIRSVVLCAVLWIWNLFESGSGSRSRGEISLVSIPQEHYIYTLIKIN